MHSQLIRDTRWKADFAGTWVTTTTTWSPNQATIKANDSLCFDIDLTIDRAGTLGYAESLRRASEVAVARRECWPKAEGVH